MKSLCLIAVLAASLAATPVAAQTRVQPKTPADMKEILTAAQSQWDAGDYDAFAKSIKQAERLATAKRNDGLLSALPDPPEGWVKVEQKPSEQIANNPFAQAMGGMMGKMVDQKYREEGGNGRMDVTLATDSPVVKMMAMAFSNPAMLEDGSELIEYGTHKAVLKSQSGKPRELQIVIDGKHLCTVKVQAMTEEQLFAVFDQKAVDRLSAAMAG